MPAHHIDEVTQNLDRIIDHSIASENRLGYFPALNRKIVVQVSRGISEHDNLVKQLDSQVVSMGRLVRRPGVLTGAATRLI